MTEQDFLFLTRRARAERITREVCAEIREALKPRHITKQQITDMVKAELVEVLGLQSDRAELTHAARKNEDAPDGKEELLTVCPDGTKIYKYWKNGTAHYRTSGGNEE